MRSRILLLIMVIALLSNFASAFLISDQGTNVKEIATGNLTELANLTIHIYDHASAGNLVFEQEFTGGIANGSWNIMIDPEIEYGKSYWKDYNINGEDLDFDGNERLEFQSSVGKINNFSFINLSLINSCPDGSSIRLIYENGSVACETDDSSSVEVALTNYALTNQSETFEGNITTAETGFFGWIGSLASRITKIWVGEINATGNIETIANVSAIYFKGDGSLLTNLPASNWDANYSNFSAVYGYATNGSSGMSWAEAVNGTLMSQEAFNTNYTSNVYSWLNTTNITYDSYNSTGLIKDWNSTGYIQNWSAVITSGGLNSYENIALTNQSNTFGDFNQTFDTNTLFVDAVSGRVGIGTTSPTFALDVRKAGGIYSSGSISTGGNLAGTILYASGGISAGSFTGTPPPSNGMIISGNVGIGTVSPSTNLEVNGTINASQILINGTPVSTSAGTSWGNAYNGTLAKTDAANSFGDFNQTFDSGALFVDAGSGRVGIGTTAPTQKLEINGNIQLPTGGKIGYFQDATHSGLIEYYNSSTGNMILNTTYNGGDIILTTNNGNVGIGTTAPEATLDVLGTALISNSKTDSVNKILQIRSNQYLSGTETEGWLPFSTYAGNNYNQVSIGGGASSYNSATLIAFFTAADVSTRTGTERMRIDSTGNVGIGTTAPSTKLDVNGTARISDHLELISDIDFYNNRGFLTLGSVSTDNAKFRSSADMELVSDGGDILMTGNVGINTTAPANTLNVKGTFNVTNVTGSPSFYVNGSGYVGIGDESPLKNLEVRAPSVTTFGLMSGTGITGLTIKGDTNGLLNFSNQNGEIMQMQLDKDVVFTGNNVGIGTTSPGTFLHVKGNGGSLRLEATTLTGQPFLEYYDNVTRKGWIGYGMGTSDNTFSIAQEEDADMNFYTKAIERIRIGNTGNVTIDTNTLFVDAVNNRVGIGTTSPMGSLDVAGSAALLGDLRFTEDSGINYIQSANDRAIGSWQPLHFGKYSSTETYLAIDSSGEVGIGTISPQNALNVIGQINATTGFIVNSSTGFTGSGTSCTITEVKGGIITGATCS